MPSNRNSSSSSTMSSSKGYLSYATQQGSRAMQTRGNPYLHPYGTAGNVATSNRPIAHMYSASAGHNTYLVHPDVRLTRLPFYEVLAELVKPTALVPQGASRRYHEATFQFHLTLQQATDIMSSRDMQSGSKRDFLTQVQLRFCLLETSCEQEDSLPPSLCVKVNGKITPLPNPIPTNWHGVEPKRPPHPINITEQVKLSPTVPNHIVVTWTPKFGLSYTVSAYLVQRLSSADLLSKLRSKGVRHADITRGLIKEKLKEDADCEIETTSFRVTLACPLGMLRMEVPCRASTCAHLQCFDASQYIKMNERKPTWICPVCNKPALFDNLVIDGYFHEVLASSALGSKDGNEIQLHGDGSWSTLIIKKEHSVNSITVAKPQPWVEMVRDDIPDSSPPKAESTASVASTSTGGSEGAALEVILITSSERDSSTSSDYDIVIEQEAAKVGKKVKKNATVPVTNTAATTTQPIRKPQRKVTKDATATNTATVTTGPIRKKVGATKSGVRRPGPLSKTLFRMPGEESWELKKRMEVVQAKRCEEQGNTFIIIGSIEICLRCGTKLPLDVSYDVTDWSKTVHCKKCNMTTIMKNVYRM